VRPVEKGKDEYAREKTRQEEETRWSANNMNHTATLGRFTACYMREMEGK